MKHSYSFAFIRWGRVLLGACLVGLLLATQLHAQTTLSTGDLVFVGYNGSDDQGFTGNGQAITPGSNVNDKFAFVLLKDVAANTKIFFTDYGWLTGGGFQPAWQPGSANNGTGAGSKDDGILSWTASTSVAAGTQIVIRCKYSIGVNIGTVASVENVSGQAYPLNLTDTAPDQLFAYQATSPRATPTLLAGVMYGGVWSTSLTSIENTSAKSTLPTSAVAGGGTAFLNLPSTSTIYNTFALGIYNCSTTVGFPRTLRTAVNSLATWKEYPVGDGTFGFLYNQDPDFLTHVPAGWDVPIACTFTVLQVTITSQPVSKTVCSYQPATFSIAAQNAQTYKWQISADGTTNWTDIANGAIYSGVTTTTLTVTNPTGLTGKYYRAVAMEPVEPSAVPSNAAQLTVNNPPQTLALTSSGPITCVVPAVRLTASSTTPGVTYAFSGPGGSITTAPGITTISAGQTGIYSVTATTLQSCTATTPITVVNDITPPTGVSLTVSSPLTCTATSVTLTAAASATSTISYTFAGPQGAVTAVGNKAVVSLAGTYTVTATASANGCSTTAITTVISNTTTPTATLTNNGPISCLVPSVTLTAGTDAGTRFVFSGGATQVGGNGSSTATVTTGGTYSVVITAANGCTNTASTTVTGSNTPISASLTASSPISCTAPTVTLTATPISGATYVFSAGASQQGGSTGNTATVTESGTYTVTVSNANSCTTSATVTVTGSSAPISASLTASGPISCTAPTVTLTATPISGAQYVFSAGVTQQGGSTGNTATISTGGVYSVVVTNANGCTATATITVNSDASGPTSVSLTGGTISCTQRSLTLTASSVGGVSYAFSGGTPLGSNQIVVSNAGTYSVVVTGANGCTTAASTTVSSDTAVPTSVSLTSGTLTCAQTSLTLTASSVGGVSYAFSGGTPLGSNQIVVTSAGAYSVIVTGANGCTAAASTTVSSAAAPPTSVSLTGGTLSCTQPSLTLTASSVGGVSYAFSGGTALGGNKVVVTSAGIYSVVVTGTNGCTAATSATVSSDTAVPTSVSLTGGILSCTQPSLTLTASSVGGVSYAFSSGTPLGSNKVVVTSVGTYSVIVTSTNGCTAAATATVTSDTAVPTAVSLTSGTLTCAQTSLTLTASSVGGVSYAFSGGTPLGSNQLVVNSPGTYSVVVTGTSGCTAVASATVEQNVAVPTAVSLTSGTLTCAQTSLTLTASSAGGVNYAFSGGTPLSGNQIVVTQAGTYSVIVTGANGCTASASTSVGGNASVPTAVSLTGGTISCTQPSLTLTASSIGGVSYTFSGGTALGSNQIVVTQAGTYSVVVTGVNGCTASASATVNSDASVPTSVSLTGGTISCAQPSVTLTASSVGGMTYTFSGGTPLGGNQVVVTSAGTYAVVVTGVNGCTASASTTVASDITVPTPSLIASGTLTCTQTSVTLAAGTGVTYAFTGPGLSQNGAANTAVVTQAGAYSVTVTGANGCSAIAATTVVSNTVAPTAALVTSGTLTCANLSVTLTASQGVTYAFSGSGLTQSGPGNTATVTQAGTYSVIVTGANGCTASASTAVVSDLTTPTASLIVSGSITCLQTSVTLTAGGNGAYMLTGPSGPVALTGNTALVSQAGTYTLVVTAISSGCQSTTTVQVIGDQTVPAPSAPITSQQNFKACLNGPSVVLTANCATGIYKWSNGATTASISQVATTVGAFPYSVSCVTANGCLSTGVSATAVISPTLLISAVMASPAAVCNGSSTTLSVSTTGGTQPFTYSWTSAPGSDALTGLTQPMPVVATVTQNSTYSVVISDAGSCTAMSMVRITMKPVPNAPTLLTSANPARPNQSVPGGQSSATVNVGDPVISVETDNCAGAVSWSATSGSSGTGNFTIPTTSPGSVTYTATCTVNGCVSIPSAPFVITVGGAPVGLQLIQPLYTCATGALTFRTTGGNGSPIEYRAIGVTDWTTNPNQTLDLPVRQDANAQPLLLQARQNGVVVTYTFDFRLFCNSTVPNQPPVFTQPPTQTATLGQLFAYRIPDNTFRDLNGTAVNFMAMNLPAGLSYASDTRVISGVPTAVGSYSVTLSVSDPLSQSASGTLLIVVNPVVQPPVSTTVNQAPVFNGPLAAQSGTVGSGFTYALPANAFTDPNAGDVLTYTAIGLPAGLSFTAGNQTISGPPTTAGVSAVTLTATDMGGLSATGTVTITISTSATPPVGPQPLVVLQPLYDCQTGAITFRTSGGDGSGTPAAPIYFSSVGIVSYSTQTSYVLEAAIRNDPNSQPLLIKATQNGVTASYLFDFRLYCNGTVVTNPPVFAGPLPVQMGTVGVNLNYMVPATTFQALNGGTLNYSVTGLPAGLGFDNTTRTISGVPTQAGSFTATITATDPLSQSGQGPLVFIITPAAQPPVGGQPLSLVAPLYNCQTGSFTFQTSGGDGSLIEYFAVGITSFSSVAGPYTVLPAGDAQPFTLRARQRGVEVTYTWDFKAVCSGGARMSAVEAAETWTLRSVGNPVTGELTVEVVGGAGQSIHLQLADEQGRLVESRLIQPTASQHREVFDVSRQGGGLLLLKASGQDRQQTLKVLKH